MRTRFQQGLDDLRQRLLRMGGLAEQAVDRARQAYVERDLTRCQMVLEGESLINTAEREIDEAAFDLLAMQQPMAVDLRFILAVTKINSDLERVGDQAVNIAERVMDMVELPAAELPVDIARMGAAVSAMVRRALESFIEGKVELAQAVLEMDSVIDRMRDDAFIQLVKTMNERPEVVRQALDALLVARNLERVADHATNIAEDVIFWVQGADVRHNVHPGRFGESGTGAAEFEGLRLVMRRCITREHVASCCPSSNARRVSRQHTSFVSANFTASRRIELRSSPPSFLTPMSPRLRDSFSSAMASASLFCWLPLPVSRKLLPLIGLPVMLPTSKMLRVPSPGRIGSTNSFPATIVLSPDGRYAALLNDGYGTQETLGHQSIAILDLKTNQIVDYPDSRLGDERTKATFSGWRSVRTASICMLRWDR